GLQGLFIGNADIFGPAAVFQPGMLGTYAGVVQPRRNRVGFDDLAVFVLHDISAVAVQHPYRARVQRSGVPAGFQALARRLDPDEPDVFVVDVRMEDAHGVRAPAHGCHDVVGLAAGIGRHLLEALVADHGLEVAHHGGIRMRARHRADDVERVFDVGHPIAHGLVEGVFERAGTRINRHHRGAEQFHAIHIGSLAARVFAAHVHHTFEPVAGSHRGGGHAVLAGAGLGDDARLAHAPGQQYLAYAVVDLV